MDKKINNYLANAPTSPGVYIFKNKKGKIIYVGKAINLKQRLRFYFRVMPTEPKVKKMVSEIAKLSFIKVTSEIEALLLEVNLIKKFRPQYNVIWRDDKRPIYVAVTKEEFPRVLSSRKVIEKDVELYGPFPSAKKTRQILKILRRVFPYHSDKSIKKPCFYAHLGLCNPCPGYINQESKAIKADLKKQYLSNIKLLKIFLGGKINYLVKTLTAEMKKTAKRENFERAAKLRDKVKLLNFLVNSRANLTDYLEIPQIFKDIGNEQNEQLKSLLKLAKLNRIEAYDIANISGKLATGSLVVFENGLAAKDQYRRFKIYGQKTANDPAMLAQVLQRRFRHLEWELPELILVDGGKSQVSASQKTLKEVCSKIPVIGLAKKFEELILPTEKKIVTYRLSADSPILQFLQRIRDEAHRFATNYHKKIRLKNLRKTEEFDK